MKSYSLRRSAKMLGIHRATLWRWMHEAGMQGRQITRLQLTQLAKAHHRIVIELPETSPTLEERVARLEQLVEQILTTEFVRQPLPIADLDELTVVEIET